MSSAAFPQGLMGKNILLGISGGIAAYKSAILARLLKKAGAEVRVVMTEGAKAFVTPLTFQALTGHAVHDTLLDPQAEAGMGHIELARWAEIILIAPGSANTIARLAHGFADDLLSTLCLASKAERYIAPAMNQQMWANPAVQRNLEQLVDDGFVLIGPAAGEQACGDIGQGRMLEPEDILALLVQSQTTSLSSSLGSPAHEGKTLAKIAAGLTIVITAGPTREALDPVRYMSNHSSGKMGYALANAAQAMGAKVTIISGPVSLPVPEGVALVSVTSAEEMMSAAAKACKTADIFIAAAAVADYRPANVSIQKIKKSAGDNLTLNLVKNPDIVATIASSEDAPFTVGFAAETEALEAHALEKLNKKHLDMIVANQVGNGRAFGLNDNAATLYWKESNGKLKHKDFPLQSKTALAQDLLQLIIERQQTRLSV